MTIEKATHKAVLYREMSAMNFAIEKLADASSVAKKLLDGSEKGENSIKFTDSPQEFSLDESVILKDVVKNKREATLGEAEILLELRELLEL